MSNILLKDIFMIITRLNILLGIYPVKNGKFTPKKMTDLI